MALKSFSLRARKASVLVVTSAIITNICERNCYEKNTRETSEKSCLRSTEVTRWASSLVPLSFASFFRSLPVNDEPQVKVLAIVELLNASIFFTKVDCSTNTEKELI